MKILQLDLIPFGPFADQTLDFSQGQHGLHLVYGPNEAGKSSTLRALTQVLYGIEPRTPDDFRYPYKNLKLGAKLANTEGKTLSFLRLKRNKDPLRTINNETLNENCLEPFLGHVDKDTFTRQFGLNWENLVAGGQEMVRSEGELGQILFAAGSGLTVLTQVQNAIEKEMRELFLAGGSVPKINELLRRHREAEDHLRQVRLSSQEWKKHAEALEEAQHLQQELAGKKKAVERNRNRLQRIQSAKMPIQKFRDTQSELEELERTVLLPAGFSKRRQEARDRLLKAGQSQAALQEDIARLAEQMQNVAVNQTVLDQAAEIEALYKQIEFYIESVKDCPIVNSKREAAEKEARHLLEQVRPGFPFERVTELRIAEAEGTLIGELGPDFKSLAERVESARRDLAESQQQLAALTESRQSQADVPDSSALKSTLKRASQKGSLEEEREEKQRAIATAERAAENDCRRLPFWSGTLKELEEIKVPLRESVNRFQSRFEIAAKQRQDLEQQRDREQAALEENLQEFARLELAGKVPTEEDLATARELREQGWQLILGCWRDGKESAAELQRFLENIEAPDLAVGFQKAITEADAISDQLRREAERVNEKKRLMAERAKCEAQLPELETKIAAQQKEFAALTQEWQDLWTPLGVTPGTPGEMLEWREDYKDLKNQLKDLNANKSQNARLGDLIEEHRGQLIAGLMQVRPALKSLEEKSLRELIELSQTVLDELSDRERQRVRLEEDIQKIEQNLPKLERGVQTAEAKLAAWQSRWAKLMAKLTLAEDATPGQANAVLTKINKLFERVGYEAVEASRVQSMEQVNRQYKERVQNLVQALAWDAKEASPTQIVGQLHAELSAAREAANQLQTLQQEQSRRESEFQKTVQQNPAIGSGTLRNVQRGGLRFSRGFAPSGNRFRPQTAVAPR